MENKKVLSFIGDVYTHIFTGDVYTDMVTRDIFTDIAHTPDQKKDLCPRRGKSRRWSGYGETFTDNLVKNGKYGEK